MAAIHVLQHVPTEGPGRIADLAREAGLDVVVHRLYALDTAEAEARVPRSIAPGDVLVVMGGPMGVGDIGDPRWPFLSDEVALIRSHVKAGLPVLGVCLGAQLMAHALGARVYPLEVGDPPVRHREVGWGPVAFTPPSAGDPILGGIGPAEVVLHWHGDTFDLPEGATLLASTLPCPNQMFRLGARAFALQFHVELRATDVAIWLESDAAFVLAANGPSGAARITADTERFIDRARETGDRLIRNILSAMLGPAA